MLTRRENLLIRPWQERRYIYHRKKVLSAIPSIDVSPPPLREHVTCKLKKQQKEIERCAKVVKDNFTLLQHLRTIKATSRVDNFWEEPPPNFLHRVGIYRPKQSKQVDDEGTNDAKQKPASRKERCLGCSPHRIPKQESIPEKRIPWEPPKARLTRRSSSLDTSGKQHTYWCDVDLPQFRGKTWGPPPSRASRRAGPRCKTGKNKKKTIKEKEEEVTWDESQAIVLSKGGLSVTVSFPRSTEVVMEGSGSGRPTIIQREFCQCKSFPSKRRTRGAVSD